MEFITPREDMILMTQQWTGERYEDGRPKVPDSILKRFEKIKTEEAWGVLHRRGYRYQFNGNMKRVHDDGRMLIGRALTAVMVPTRPDVHMNMLRHGREDKGFKGFFNRITVNQDEITVFCPGLDKAGIHIVFGENDVIHAIFLLFVVVVVRFRSFRVQDNR